MLTIRRGLYRSLVKGPPEPQVPVKQPKIPGLGANHKNRSIAEKLSFRPSCWRVFSLWVVAARFGTERLL